MCVRMHVYVCVSVGGACTCVCECMCVRVYVCMSVLCERVHVSVYTHMCVCVNAPCCTLHTARVNVGGHTCRVGFFHLGFRVPLNLKLSGECSDCRHEAWSSRVSVPVPSQFSRGGNKSIVHSKQAWAT